MPEIDLGDKELYALGHPEEVWAELRRDWPVYWNTRPDGSGFWALTRYGDAVAVLKDARTFRSAPGMRLDADPAATAAAAGRLLIVTDAPRHAKIRRLLASAFTPRVAARLARTMRVIVREELEMVVSGVPCEFSDVASVLPLAVICDLLGVPKSDWAFMLRCTRIAFGESDSSPMDRLGAHADILSYYDELLHDRRRSPQEDLISVMAHGLVDGTNLTDEEIFLNCDGLISGGNETTRHASVGGLLALIENPDQWPGGIIAPKQIDPLVNEILRYTSPAMHVLRTACEDVEIGGKYVRAGAAVTVWLPSANRDDAAFESPDRFDVSRDPNSHVAFGAGPHHCLGAMLARTELSVFFSELLSFVAGVELAGSPRRLSSNLIWGFESLPVVLCPR